MNKKTYQNSFPRMCVCELGIKKKNEKKVEVEALLFFYCLLLSINGKRKLNNGKENEKKRKRIIYKKVEK